MIPYGKQDIQNADVDAVLKVLKSDFLTQGPVVPKFEDSVKSYCAVNHAIAVSSATAALHIALLALKVSPGDIVWTSPNTFVATSNAALYCGADIDFVDIEPNNYNMSITKLESKLIEAKLNNCLPKVVVPVHLAGQSCDMKAIYELSLIYKFKVVEDASHAIGGEYCGAKIGNCQFSDITVFSFHPVKIITTAEGGMALTNDDELAFRLNLYRSHGITRDPKKMTHEMDGSWYYQQVELGFNYRMTDIQAALGCSQMLRLQKYISKRHQIASRYDKELVNLPIILPHQETYSYSAYHLYIIRLELNKIKPLTHKDVFETLRANGILVNIHYIPVHTQPYYKALGFKKGDFPNAEKYYNEAISIPIYATLTDEDQSFVIKYLKEILEK
jgi:UDP-4-amino-4,6-dideoxy-N-acetyl-beta-L-altrosamine transaminase